MCGIAGIFHYADPERPVDRELLARMTRVLAHRGPDAESFFVKDNIGFGHRRLSIVDLSPTGAQPMLNDDGACCITYNGEFYNHGEFRPRLAARGARFRGSSDTETLLRLLELDGPSRLADTAGIFAFGFWDARSRSLILARDPLGVKQLYFHDNGRRIVFASEIKALFEDPEVPREADPEGINQYLHFHTALFDRTFFRGIRQLRAGEYMRVSRHGASLRTYWRVDDFTKVATADSELIDDLRHRLTHIVGDQLMSDVPVGSFFSGGIDSSAVAAFASQAGRTPVCFGVHFSGQGVTDERPYQEAAAAALGLDLRLITMDGSTFPDDFRRLMYQQDEPVIGSALFPMARVSELASRSVKVCLGGQAADEIFGGYARYALGHPMQVIRSWFVDRHHAAANTPNPEVSVGGNLGRQFAEGGTLYRLARNGRHLIHWETAYFEHFAKVPERSWQEVFSGPEFCSRSRCRQLFHEVVRRSPASEPMDKIMHWDLQTYLTGLFHQDDRMSMASSLESRVPLADPRLVRFAFKVPPDFRFRGGASKWLLRKAVSTMLPPLVLNRRKVGFDTPAETWIAQHDAFVRDTLLSSRSRSRGFWHKSGIESLLESRDFDRLWKVLSIELWASIFLDSRIAPSSADSALGSSSAAEIRTVSPDPAPEIEARPPLSLKLRYLARECVELGLKGTLARAAWETKIRGGLTRLAIPEEPDPTEERSFLGDENWKLPFANPKEVGESVHRLLGPPDAARLGWLASEATRGRILCFGRWMGDFGNPVDWHRDPTNESRWPADSHWAKSLRADHPHTDVKLTWEAGRFPQAYFFGRAAALDPVAAPVWAGAFADQVRGFIDSNPPGFGLHWFSGQEIAFRQFAWLFGFHVFSSAGLVEDSLRKTAGNHFAASASHIARHIEYARDSVYNNHLLSEALGLFAAGCLLSGSDSERWKAVGHELLVEEANHQVYPDGGYIQQSHTYHRVAMEIYLWATALVRANGVQPPAEWLGAMERSLDFLLAHQNDADGRLPNFGSNDGSDPIVLSTCDFTDFRPILQSLSIATRGERIFGPGPHDEMAAWLFGAKSLNLPTRHRAKTSVSLSHTGYHVLRGREPRAISDGGATSDGGSFGAFRCGSILDRFAQIDMLHVDIWWRGENVLTDAGSYLYNGQPLWHNYFLRTGSHNTVQIDGRDQMPHVRQFKTLYRTQARLLHFDDNPDWALASGEHYGYLRGEHCLHRRAVLYLKREDFWIVADAVSGAGFHRARIHWLAGDYPYDFDAEAARLDLHTPKGDFSLTVLGSGGAPIHGADVVRGGEDPPRGWLSRYYAEKIPVPSLAATIAGPVPVAFVTLAGAGNPVVSVDGDLWTVTVNETAVSFRIHAGAIEDVETAPAAVTELQR